MARIAVSILPMIVALLCCTGAAASASPSPGQAIAEKSCAACHGADGNSANSLYPKLAGQEARYLDDQLQAFADGSRSSDIMGAIAKTLSAQDMADVSAYYSRQQIKPDPSADAQAIQQGRRLFFYGNGRAPACAMCHRSAGGGGMPMMMGHGRMMGMMGAGPIPNLADQHAAYLVGQLDRYAKGERRSRQMNQIAAALSEQDRSAIAAYLASLR